MVMGDDSCSRGHGFESLHCILDGHDVFSHLFVVKLYILFEKTKNKPKSGRSWPMVKKLFNAANANSSPTI